MCVCGGEASAVSVVIVSPLEFVQMGAPPFLPHEQPPHLLQNHELVLCRGSQSYLLFIPGLGGERGRG